MNRYSKVRSDALGGGEPSWLVVEAKPGRADRVMACCAHDFDAEALVKAMTADALSRANLEMEKRLTELAAERQAQERLRLDAADEADRHWAARS